MRLDMFDIGDPHVVVIEEVRERRERVIKYSVQVESLKLNIGQDVADVLDFDDEPAVVAEQQLGGFDEGMRVLQMREHAAGNDGISLAMGSPNLKRRLLVKERANGSQAIVVGDL